MNAGALVATTLAAAALVGAGVALAGTGDQEPDATASADVRAAPWGDMAQADGSPSLDAVQPSPSLRFSPGVSYAEALRLLYVSAVEQGTVPGGTVLEEPLPTEVVVLEPATADEGLRLSLTAPWGWTLEGRLIRPPSIALPGRLSPDEAAERFARARQSGRAVPEEGRLDIPLLEPCQRARGDASNRPACR